MIQRMKKQWRNARAVSKQLQGGEWEFRYNELCGHCCTARRNDLELWVGSGAWFCEIRGTDAFGLIFRHYVWYAAARRARKSADREGMKIHPKIPDLCS